MISGKEKKYLTLFCLEPKLSRLYFLFLKKKKEKNEKRIKKKKT